MRLNQSSIWAILLAGGLLFVGCATDETAYLPKFKPVQPVEVAPTRDAEELERRIQAMAHFGAGVSYELRGEQAKAQEEFYQAAMADSTNEPVVVEAARRLIRQKDSDRAISLLIQATGNSKASANLYALLGVAYAQAGKQELAILASDSALQKNPKLPQAYQNLIQIYLQNERLPEALKVLAKASQQKGGDAGFYTSLAELYLAITRAHPTEMDRLHPRILTLLAEAKRLNTDSAAVLQRMGEAFRSLGEFAQAAEAYARMQVLFPGNPQVRERLTELYLQSGNRKKAAELIEELLRDFPANPQGNYLLGLIAADEKQFARAVEFLSKAVLLDPEMETAYHELASMQLALEKPQEALATLDKARARFRSNFILEFYSSLVQSRLKDYPKALRHLVAAETHARATEPQRLTPQFYFQLGATLERNKNHAEAEKYFLLAIKQLPDFADALNYLGYMWVERGERMDEAKLMIEKAVKAEPTNAAFLDSMAWVLFKLGRAREALDWQLRALKHLKEPDATLHEHLGDIYLSLKQPSKSREHWRKSLAIETNAEIQKKLDALPK